MASAGLFRLLRHPPSPRQPFRLPPPLRTSERGQEKRARKRARACDTYPRDNYAIECSLKFPRWIPSVLAFATSLYALSGEHLYAPLPLPPSPPLFPFPSPDPFNRSLARRDRTGPPRVSEHRGCYGSQSCLPCFERALPYS